MTLRLLPPPPLAIWPAAEPSPLERLEELEAEKLRLRALGPWAAVREVEDRLRRLRASGLRSPP